MTHSRPATFATKSALLGRQLFGQRPLLSVYCSHQNIVAGLRPCSYSASSELPASHRVSSVIRSRESGGARPRPARGRQADRARIRQAERTARRRDPCRGIEGCDSCLTATRASRICDGCRRRSIPLRQRSRACRIAQPSSSHLSDREKAYSSQKRLSVPVEALPRQAQATYPKGRPIFQTTNPKQDR
jgi:hypothetical protein